jgi:hypothetical protein
MIDPVEIAYAVLMEHAPEPIHYRELWKAVKGRGGRLEGQEPAQVLVSRLVRDERFVRPLRRGYYALRAHYPNAKNIGSRKPKRPGRRVQQRAVPAGKNGLKGESA